MQKALTPVVPCSSRKGYNNSPWSLTEWTQGIGWHKPEWHATCKSLPFCRNSGCMAYLSHSTVLRPPCGTGCFQRASRTQHTRNRWCAKSAGAHASLPVDKTATKTVIVRPHDGLTKQHAGALCWVPAVRVCARCTHPHDLGVAAGTGWGKVLAVAVLAVHAVLLLHKAVVSQRVVAVVAVELLRVPRAAQGHQE